MKAVFSLVKASLEVWFQDSFFGPPFKRMESGAAVVLIEVCKPQKYLGVLDCTGDWPFSDCFDLCVIHLYALLRNKVSQDHDGGMVQFAFVNFDE